MEIWDDDTSRTSSHTTQPVRGGSVSTFILLGSIGCLLTFISIIALVSLLSIYVIGLFSMMPLVEIGIQYTHVAGLVLIGVGFWGLYTRYDSVLSIISAFGFFALAGIGAVPSGLIIDFILNIVLDDFVALIMYSFIVSGIGLIAALCGAFSIFLIREETADWRFAIVASIGFLAWAIVPFIESVLYVTFYDLITWMPYMLVFITNISLVYVSRAAGAFLGMLFMWIDRFE